MKYRVRHFWDHRAREGARQTLEGAFALSIALYPYQTTTTSSSIEQQDEDGDGWRYVSRQEVVERLGAGALERIAPEELA